MQLKMHMDFFLNEIANFLLLIFLRSFCVHCRKH